MISIKIRVFLICVSYLGIEISAAPSLIVTPTESSNKNFEKEENHLFDTIRKSPQIYRMHVQSTISNRFSRTTITSKVRNEALESQEAVFSVVLPETAFISGFIMEVGGNNHTAYVKEKEEAKRDYEQAVESGLAAAHIAVSVRDSNRFTISVNVEPEANAAFYLTYEELLKRKNGRYEQVINLHPGQPVMDLSVEVLISETRKIIDLKTLPLRSGNEVVSNELNLDPRANLEFINDTTAIGRFSPSVETQKQLAHFLGTKEEEGLAGQFVVQYDVERDPNGGELLVQDGYFVHFFAPTELKPLPKYVVFVLDTSTSMLGTKIEQLKEAFDSILEQLHENDTFSLIEFNTNAKVLNLNNPNASVYYPYPNYNYRDYDEKLDFGKHEFPKADVVNPDSIKQAKEVVSRLEPSGGTDIYSALKVGLHLVELATFQNMDDINRQPILLFLTDGKPTIRLRSAEVIENKISEFNIYLRKAPIFALSFGEKVDKDFVRKLAFRNAGFSRHIYEAGDAALQLKDFYREISSPLLSNVTFKYQPSVTSLTTTEFPIHFGGSELVISGKCDLEDVLSPIVNGWGEKEMINFHPPVIEKSVSNVERLWAYLRIKQLLQLKEVANNRTEEITKTVLDLALKYSFVTPVSSLVVVKPSSTDVFDYNNVVPEAEETSIDRIFTGSIQYTTTKRPLRPLTTSSSAAVSLFRRLPWLKDVLDDDGILKLPSGDYKLGLNETIADLVVCSQTPLHTEGHCSLLHACPQIHFFVRKISAFTRHACILKKEYAGVCCPSTL